MMRRWKFHDPDGVLADYTFWHSPASRDDPELDEAMDALPTGVRGEYVALPQAPAPMDWTFKGVVYSLAELGQFETWLDNARPIHVTDHHNQTWRIQIHDMDTTRKGSRLYPEKQEVTVRCLMLGKV